MQIEDTVHITIGRVMQLEAYKWSIPCTMQSQFDIIISLMSCKYGIASVSHISSKYDIYTIQVIVYETINS